MAKKAPAILLAAAAALSACGGSPAEKAVASLFGDPGSVRFQSVRDRTRYVCGEVNGRGSDHRYQGYKRFVYAKGSEAALIDPHLASADRDIRISQADCGKPAAYQSVDERMNCAWGPAAKAEANRQGSFEKLWRTVCA